MRNGKIISFCDCIALSVPFQVPQKETFNEKQVWNQETHDAWCRLWIFSFSFWFVSHRMENRMDEYEEKRTKNDLLENIRVSPLRIYLHRITLIIYASFLCLFVSLLRMWECAIDGETGIISSRLASSVMHVDVDCGRLNWECSNAVRGLRGSGEQEKWK